MAYHHGGEPHEAYAKGDSIPGRLALVQEDVRLEGKTNVPGADSQDVHGFPGDVQGIGVEGRILWAQEGVAGCDQGRTLEVLKVPLNHLARVMGSQVAPWKPGRRKTARSGIEVPLPMNDGRVSRGRVHGMLSHCAVRVNEPFASPKVIIYPEEEIWRRRGYGSSMLTWDETKCPICRQLNQLENRNLLGPQRVAESLLVQPSKEVEEQAPWG